MPLIQQLDRVVHTTSTGIEVTRQFYVEPYHEHRGLIFRLQGSVIGGGRRPPAHDPYIRNCYCNETLTTYAAKEVLASSDALSKNVGVDVNEQLKVREEPDEGLAGALVTAHYRPLLTAWTSSDPFKPDTDEWDWIDPIVKPGVRMLPWTGGLYVQTEAGTRSVPPETANPITVPVDDITIRRLFLSKVPWQAIDGLKGAVNTERFPPANHAAFGGFADCESRTLKFEGADVHNMLDTAGNRWFELTYHFKHLGHASGIVYAFDGTERPDAAVTWNHVFTSPTALKVIKGKTGWYEVWRGLEENLGFLGLVKIQRFGLALFGGKLYNEGDFLDLFK